MPGKGRGTSPESKDFGLSRRLRAGRKDIILLGKSVFHFTSKTLSVSVDGSSVNNFQRGSEIITNQGNKYKMSNVSKLACESLFSLCM